MNVFLKIRIAISVQPVKNTQSSARNVDRHVVAQHPI